MDLFRSLNKLVLETLSSQARTHPGSLVSMLNIEERTESLFASLCPQAIDRVCDYEMPLVILDCHFLGCSFSSLLSKMEANENLGTLVKAASFTKPEIRSPALSIINATLIIGLAVSLKMDGGADQAIMTTGTKLEDAKALRNSTPLAWAKVGEIDIPLFSLRMSEHSILHMILQDQPSQVHLSRYLTS
jgi:hypothetical protein